MVSSRQRQRQLARARYERQQSRRQTRARRRGIATVVVGTLVGLIVVAALGWLILHIVDEEKQRDPTSPTPSGPFSTDLRTPSSNVPSTPGKPTGSTTEPESSEPTPATPTSTQGPR